MLAYLVSRCLDVVIEEIVLEINEEHIFRRINERLMGIMHMDLLIEALDNAFKLEEVFTPIFYDMKYGEGFIIELKDYNCSVLCSVKDIETVKVSSVWRGYHFRKGVGQHIIQIRDKVVKLFTFEEGGRYIVWNPCEA